MGELYRYAAFISYSSKDARFAKRLHQVLEGYQIPRSLGAFDLLGEGKPNRVYPVFRDREELAAGNLSERLQASLRASAALIVVCSKNAAASPWVEKEIEFFRGLGRGERIFAIVSDLAPVGGSSDDTPQFFPRALNLAGGDGAHTDTPLAADARKGRDGFRGALLKLVAGLVGVSVGDLVDRDRRQRGARRSQLVAAISAVAIAASAAGLWLQSRTLEERSIALAELARVASDEGDFDGALRYARAGLSPYVTPFFQFQGDAASAELRRAYIEESANGFILLQGHEGYSSASVSPNEHRIVTWGDDGTLRAWSADTGEQLWRTSSSGADFRYIVTNGSRILASDGDSQVALVREADGAILARLPAGLRVSALSPGAFAPNGEAYVLGMADGSVRIYSSAAGRELANVRVHQGAVSYAAFSGDGRRIISADDRFVVLLNADDATELSRFSVAECQWDAEENGAFRVLCPGEPFAWIANDHPTVYVSDVSADASRVLTISRNAARYTVQVWDTVTGHEQARLTELNGEIVTGASFSPDGARILTTSVVTGARIWNTLNGSEVRTLTSSAACAAYSADGQRVISLHGNVVELFDATNGRELGRYHTHYDAGCTFSMSNDNAFLVTGFGQRGVFRVWRTIPTLEEMPIESPLSQTTQLIDRSADNGRLLAVAGFDASVRDARSGAELLKITQGRYYTPIAHLSDDGRRLLIVNADELPWAVEIWDVDRRVRVARLSEPGAPRLVGADFMEAAGQVMAASENGQVLVWDARTSTRVRSHDAHARLFSAAVDPAGARLAVGDMAGRIHIWDSESRETVLESGPRGAIFELAFNHRGNLLAATNADNSVWIWDVNAGRVVMRLRPTTSPVIDYSFTRDDSLMLARTVSGEARVWDLRSGHEVWRLPFAVRGAILDSTASRIIAFDEGGMPHTWTLPVALFLPRRELADQVCGDLGSGSEPGTFRMSAFLPSELTAAPFLNATRFDACRGSLR